MKINKSDVEDAGIYPDEEDVILTDWDFATNVNSLISDKAIKLSDVESNYLNNSNVLIYLYDFKCSVIINGEYRLKITKNLNGKTHSPPVGTYGLNRLFIISNLICLDRVTFFVPIPSSDTNFKNFILIDNCWFTKEPLVFVVNARNSLNQVVLDNKICTVANLHVPVMKRTCTRYFSGAEPRTTRNIVLVYSKHDYKRRGLNNANA